MRPSFTSIAREMSVRGDWVVPTFNAGVFYDKAAADVLADDGQFQGPG